VIRVAKAIRVSGVCASGCGWPLLTMRLPAQRWASNRCMPREAPRECERLQGFADDYTLISYRGKPAADGPRYKSLGNSMAVPVMSWIGQRLQQVLSC